MQRPRLASRVVTQSLPPLDETLCWQCGAAPAERMRPCRSCGALLAEAAERRDEDVHAERVLVPLVLQAGDVLGGPLTLLAVETLPNSFVVRLHHDIDWAVPGVYGAELQGTPGRRTRPRGGDGR
jgi:hypothetical protein